MNMPASASQSDLDNVRLLAPSEVAERLSVSVRTLCKWRRDRTGPAFLRRVGQIRYSETDVQAFLSIGRCNPVQQSL